MEVDDEAVTTGLVEEFYRSKDFISAFARLSLDMQDLRI